MKTKIFAVIALAVLGIAVSGCVSTVAGDKTTAVPFVKDKLQQNYERPRDNVFQAAKEVINANGVLVHESIQYGQTNVVDNIAKVLEGKINQRSVWVRVVQADARISSVTVQTRTSGGAPDMDLASSIITQIALKLVR